MPYHHGNLREALVEASLELARKGGPDEVVLRAASREASVSHNAAYRHFADRDDLLWAVCERCFAVLTDRMETALRTLDAEAGGDPVDRAWRRLDVVGRAYVGFALDEPGWFRTAFGVPQGRPLSEDRPNNPYRILNKTLDRLVEVGAIPAERRPHAEVAAWSAVHGLAALILDGPLRDTTAAERITLIDRVMQLVAAGL